MKGRACLSMAANGLGKLFSPEATNFRATAELLIVGGVAHLSDSTWIAYASYTLALVEASLGAKQMIAARFFAEKKVEVASVEVVQPEEFHDLEPETPSLLVKKTQ